MDWKVVFNKKNLFFVFLGIVAFLIAYTFDRYYIFREKGSFLTKPLEFFGIGHADPLE